jgi:hypothetical protein
MADLKYQKGDTVTIKSIVWYESRKDKQGRVICGHESFHNGMACFCGKQTVVRQVNFDSYDLDIDKGRYFWNDLMFE